VSNVPEFRWKIVQGGLEAVVGRLYILLYGSAIDLEETQSATLAIRVSENRIQDQRGKGFVGKGSWCPRFRILTCGSCLFPHSCLAAEKASVTESITPLWECLAARRERILTYQRLRSGFWKPPRCLRAQVKHCRRNWSDDGGAVSTDS